MIIKKQVYEKLTEGLHNVQITKVDDLGLVETKNGAKMRCRIVFTAQDQKDVEGKPVDIFMNVNQSIGPKSTLGKLLTQLGFTNIGSEFDLDDIVGIKCQVVVEHVENDGQVYANVASVIKQRKTQEV